MKKRKHPELWQYYLQWREVNEMKKRHLLRISAIERGDSEMVKTLEVAFMESIGLVATEDRPAAEDVIMDQMVAEGEKLGAIWHWLVGLKGIAGPTAAKLLAQIDDAADFDYISKLWRFAGYGLFDYWVDESGKVKAPKHGYKWRKKDGEMTKVWTVPKPKDDWTLKTMIDRNLPGWHSPYNRILKSEVWVAVDNFVKQRTPVYRDIYDKHKAEQRRLHPEKLRVNGRFKFNDGHIDARARRKTAKIFLYHLWSLWRESEGLEAAEPWIIAQDNGHNRMIEAPNLEVFRSQADREIIANVRAKR